MPAEYHVRVYSPQGVLQAYIDNFLSLIYSKRVWEPGLLQLKLLANDPKVQYLVDNAQVEVWRRNPDRGINWYCDFYGLMRKRVIETPQNVTYFTAHCPGQMTMLGWSYVLWPDRTDLRSTFTSDAAETVMKNLVAYNLTSVATTANGRLISWPTTLPGTITVATDLTRGNVIDWKCPFKNVLTELQAIAKVSGGDFDLVKTGAATWQFQFYPNQLGTDRTAAVVFSLENGNMMEPSYTLDKIAEETIVLVAGRGDANNGVFVSVTGSTYSVTSNYIEGFVSARDSDTNAYMTAKGQEELYKAQARNKLSFKVLQTPSCAYGRDYFLGDLVKGHYNGIDFTQKVFGVTVRFEMNGSRPEDIQVEMRDP